MTDEIVAKFARNRSGFVKASQRYQLIAPLLEGNLEGKERVERQKEIAKECNLSYRTLSRYLNDYRSGGFEALVPKERSGRTASAIPEELLEEAIRLRREQPGRSVADIVKILEKEGKAEKGSIHRSTLQKALLDNGWSKKQMRMYIGSTAGKSATRFQKTHRMELVQADIKYGPQIPDLHGKKEQTYFVGCIDDYSRMLVFGRFYHKQSEEEVLDAYRSMLIVYGAPQKLVVDNGKQFISERVITAMSIVGTKVRKARPYSPATKGKIESFNHRLNRFIEESMLKDFQSLETLNAAFTAWLYDYNNCPHEAHKERKDGLRTPREVFEADTSELRLVDADTLTLAFADTGERWVQKDGTISIDGRRYIVENLNLIGFKVCFARLRDAMESVTIFRKGFQPCMARPLEIGEDVDYEARLRGISKGRISASTSRMLDAMMDEYDRENGTSLPRDEAPVSFASLARMDEEERE